MLICLRGGNLSRHIFYFLFLNKLAILWQVYEEIVA